MRQDNVHTYVYTRFEWDYSFNLNIVTYSYVKTIHCSLAVTEYYGIVGYMHVKSTIGAYVLHCTRLETYNLQCRSYTKHN